MELIASATPHSGHFSSDSGSMGIEDRNNVSDGGCSRCAERLKELINQRTAAKYWEKMHRRAVGREGKLKEQVRGLQARIKQRERELFAKRSESQGKSTDGRPEASEEEKKRSRGQQSGTDGHGRRCHENLPAESEEHDLPEDQKHCSTCELPFKPFGETKDSEVVEIEVKAHRRLIKRRRYVRTCQCPGQPRIITAPAPPKLIPKGCLGVSVWVMLLVDKFMFQRPTYRLLADLRLTCGLAISMGTVTGGFERLSALFMPIYEAIRERNVSECRWHADETRWLVFEEIEGKQGNKWYMWAFLSITTVFFKLDPSRSSRVPRAHFGEKARGILNVDRYSAYKVLQKDGRILLAFCWAHVRRDFLGLAKDWGEALEVWGLGWVDKIAMLYHLNKQRLAVLNDPQAFGEVQAKLAAALDQMASERDAQLADANLHRACHKVLESLKQHWPGLVLFLKHPEVSMDNNRAERAQRPHVVGRKNYYGSGAKWSGELAAMMFSLFQTLLLWDINPRAWLSAYLNACAENGGKAPAAVRRCDADQWLPWNAGEEQLRAWRIQTRDGP